MLSRISYDLLDREDLIERYGIEVVEAFENDLKRRREQN